MGLLDDLRGSSWERVRDGYEVTSKPRGVDWSAVDAVPFAPMEAIPQGGEFMPEFATKALNDLSSGTYFETGDLLVAKITPSFENGKQALVTDLQASFGYATTEVIPLRPSGDEHDRRFLFYYLLHPDVRHYVAERMEGSTGRQRVPTNVLLDLPVPAFTGADQTRMADALHFIRSAVGVENRAYLLTCELKLAALHELFTRGPRGGPQKETEIGPAPESWDVVAFETVRAWLQYGTSVRCTVKPDVYPVLRIPNIEPGRVNVGNLKYCALSPDNAHRYILEEGDLLFIRTNGVLKRLGSCAVYRGEPATALFASYLIRARLKPDIEPRFVAYFYESLRGNALVAGRATPAADGKYNLNTGTIDSLPFLLPPTPEEQREVVEVLDAIDRKIDLHRRKRDLLDELFKSLLHKLMTGEIRVSDLDLSALPSAQEATS